MRLPHRTPPHRRSLFTSLYACIRSPAHFPSDCLLPSPPFRAIVACMAKRPFLMRLYFEPAFFESARIIGYDGLDIADFWKAAKKLNLPQHDILMAVYDLTKADKRGRGPSRGTS